MTDPAERRTRSTAVKHTAVDKDATANTGNAAAIEEAIPAVRKAAASKAEDVRPSDKGWQAHDLAAKSSV